MARGRPCCRRRESNESRLRHPDRPAGGQHLRRPARAQTRPDAMPNHLLSPNGQQTKWVPAGKVYFPGFASPERGSDLISLGSSGAGRPAKHLYGLDRAGQSPGPLPRRPQPACQGRDQNAAARSRNTVSSPTRGPFKLPTAAGSFHWERHGSSFLRTCGWGGCAKSFSSFQRRFRLQAKRAGGDSEPSRSRPRRSNGSRFRPLATGPNQIAGVLPGPTPTGGAQAPWRLVGDSSGPRV